MFIAIISVVIVVDLVAAAAILLSLESLRVKVAWLAAVLLLPIVGAVLFFVAWTPDPATL